MGLRGIAETDENGQIEETYYDKDRNTIDATTESKFLDDVDLANDISPNPTETKSQTEDAQIQNCILSVF